MTTIICVDGKSVLVPDSDPRVPAPVTTVQSTILQPRDFVALFTLAEQQTLFESSDWRVKMFIGLALAGPVDLSNAEVIGDIETIQALGLITSDRAQAILAGQSPA